MCDKVFVRVYVRESMVVCMCVRERGKLCMCVCGVCVCVCACPHTEASYNKPNEALSATRWQYQSQV